MDFNCDDLICLKCMGAHGYDFVVGGIMESFNLNRAYQTGLDIYGVIWLPCANSSEASCVTSDTIVGSIESQPYRHRLRGVYVDVDGMTLNQSSARTFLPRFIKELKHVGENDGWRVGIVGNDSSWERAVGANWTIATDDVDLMYTSGEGHDGAFVPFAKWRRANITQFPPRPIDICHYERDSALYVNNDAVKRTDANQPLLDDESDLSDADAENAIEPFAERSLRNEIKLMASGRVGGAVIVPKALASEDPLLREILERAHLINKPLVEGALVKMFDTDREGHDGAVIVEVVDRSEPWIHSSRVRLPYNESEHVAVIQNRGLRHNSAAFACSRTDALIIVVSEERGKISLFHRGTYNLDISKKDFAAKLGAFMPSVEL